jgi:hypothetical protein
LFAEVLFLARDVDDELVRMQHIARHRLVNQTYLKIELLKDQQMGRAIIV